MVKDGSKLISDSNILENNRIDFAVFFKKDFYEPPVLELDTINPKKLNLIQKGVEGKLKIIQK